MSIIDDFLVAYQREIHIKAIVAQLAEEQCRKFLADSGLRAIVSSRAKDPERLRAKLEKRMREDGKEYATLDDIRNDIHDLSGVRIALYSPTDIATVSDRIKELFTVREEKTFPDKRGSEEARLKGAASGYLATHYRVYMKDDSLSNTNKGLASDLVEIQVASLLMHAWSEVEHDLRYKQLSGKLSSAEDMLLDGLNDLIIAGETALIRIQRATNERIEGRDEPFEDPYNLAAYLYNALQQKMQGPVAPIGRTDILLSFLKQLGLDRPKQLFLYLDVVYADVGRPVLPVASQIVDTILMRDPRLFREFEVARQQFQFAFPTVSNTLLYAFYEEWVVSVISFHYLGGPVMSEEYRTSANNNALKRAAFPGDVVDHRAVIFAREVYFALIQEHGDVEPRLKNLGEIVRVLRFTNNARLPQLSLEQQNLITVARGRFESIRPIKPDVP